MRTTMVRLLLNAAPADGGGNTDPPAPTKPDASFQRRLKEAGNAGALAGTLYNENQHLQSQLAAAKARIPKDGSVVLSGDDVAAWNEFKSLGIAPKDVTAGLAERDTLKAENARHVRDGILAGHGYNARTLGPLLPADAVVAEEDGPKDAKGQATKVLTIKLAGAEKPVPLAEHIDSALADFKPVVGGPQARGEQERQPTFRGAPTAPTPRREPPPPGGDRNVEPREAARRELLSSGSYSW